MIIPREAKLLRIFLGEDDRYEGRPAHEAIVELARRRHIAGCTVLRGVEGFGHASVIHTTRILRLSADLPIVIEMVDAPDKIEALLGELEPMIGGGLVTTERVEVHLYTSVPKPGER
jgi:PII-like signaling protein